jgi:hypothetical protein
MKKILLVTGLFSLVLVGRSQTVLNEVYTEPGNGHTEFIELYNSSTSLIPQNLDCFTIVTYYRTGNGANVNQGFYVLDLPNLTVASKSFFVLAAASPFNTQSTTGSIADVNWNNAAALNALNGSLKQYSLNAAGTAYTSSIPANLQDFMPSVSINGQNYYIMLFQNGALINAFYGGDADGLLPTEITSLPDLPVVGNSACSTFTIDFSTFGAGEFVGSSPGSDNGFARTSDGKCGTWVKTSASVQHTPGTTNGSASGLAGQMTTQELIHCNTSPGKSSVEFDITAISGAVTEADDFPVEVQLYYDLAPVGTLGGTDLYYKSKFISTVAAASDTFQIVPAVPIILVYKTKRGCFDRVVSLLNSCAALPVSFKSFTATRFNSNVMVKWETAWEQNNSGFAVERNVNGTWVQIAWVASQAAGGNSDRILSYSFTDANDLKGISQYRIRQMDIDGKAKYSEIRSVRGDGQMGKLIVFPNPTNDGRVTISFDNGSDSRIVSVIDMSGRSIKEYKNVTNNSLVIDNLQPGMYTLKVVVPQTGEQAVQKIVVNKR